jgi:hypothetical protein
MELEQNTIKSRIRNQNIKGERYLSSSSQSPTVLIVTIVTMNIHMEDQYVVASLSNDKPTHVTLTYYLR